MKRNLLILAALLIIIESCKKDGHEDAVFSFEDDNSELIADGISKRLVTLKIIDNLQFNKHVKLTTSNGKFILINSTSATQPTDNIIVTARKDKAMAYLVSSTLPDENVLVTAQIDDDYFPLNASFIPSRPDSFQITTDANDVPVTETQVILNGLYTTFDGRPITGVQYVYFTTQILRGNTNDFSLPAYQKIIPDSNGATTATTLKKLTTDTAAVEITATILNQNNDSMVKQFIINFNK